MGRTSFTAHRAFRYDALRLMSYSVDCALGHGEICFARCVRYVLYPSLRQCGPFLFYRDFETKRCDGGGFRGRASYAALEMMDSLAWYAFLRFARRTLSSPVDEGLGTARKLALAWTHTTAVWAGPTLVFNFHHALAVFEGQVVARDVFEFWTSSATSSSGAASQGEARRREETRRRRRAAKKMQKFASVNLQSMTSMGVVHARKRAKRQVW